MRRAWFVSCFFLVLVLQPGAFAYWGECDSDADCNAPWLGCLGGYCKAIRDYCESDAECIRVFGGNTPAACNLEKNRCVVGRYRCETDSDCPASHYYCNVSDGMCRPREGRCDTESDCGTKFQVKKPYCNSATHLCTDLSCKNDSDCLPFEMCSWGYCWLKWCIYENCTEDWLECANSRCYPKLGRCHPIQRPIACGLQNLNGWCDAADYYCKPNMDSCDADSDCLPSETCDSTHGLAVSCRLKSGFCNNNADCRAYQRCDFNASKCIPRDGFCENDSDCVSWKRCGPGNQCALGEGRCDNDSDCIFPGGLFCNQTANSCRKKSENAAASGAMAGNASGMAGNGSSSAENAAVSIPAALNLAETVVILAQTDETAGTTPASRYSGLFDGINDYYGKNSYGAVRFNFTLLIPHGNGSGWFTAGGNSLLAAGKEEDFGRAAIKKAFGELLAGKNSRARQIIVVYPGFSRQVNATYPFLTQQMRLSKISPIGDVLLDPAFSNGSVGAESLIVVSEHDGMGTWAHELAHTLPSRYNENNVLNAAEFLTPKINDRYNYESEMDRQYGDTSYWDLMCLGNYWGNPHASSPTHISSFTKAAAGWLEIGDPYLPGNEVELRALEDMRLGGTVQTFTDPSAESPGNFYILEARDGNAAYGAPESGVVLYKVSNRDWHYVVNSLSPQQGKASAIDPDGREYQRPTLHLSTGDSDAAAAYWFDPKDRFNVSLLEFGKNPVRARVAVKNVSISLLKGWILKPLRDLGAIGAPGWVGVSSQNEPRLELDLHAIDGKGRHVGMDYTTGGYENLIPGAVASGDLLGDEEWIYVPADSDADYYVSDYRASRFFDEHPEAREALLHETGFGYLPYEITTERIDWLGRSSKTTINDSIRVFGRMPTLGHDQVLSCDKPFERRTFADHFDCTLGMIIGFPFYAASIVFVKTFGTCCLLPVALIAIAIARLVRARREKRQRGK